MTTDWKALCVELAKVLAEEYGVQREFANGDPLLGSGAIELLSRARIALSQPEPEGLTDEELLAIAAASIDPYQDSGIAIGEYEPETECAVEVYGSELITFARAVGQLCRSYPEAMTDADRYQWIKRQKNLVLSTEGVKWINVETKEEYYPSHRLDVNGTGFHGIEQLDDLIDKAMEIFP